MQTPPCALVLKSAMPAGSSSSTRKQWPSLTHSVGSLPSSSGRKEAVLQARKSVSQSQALPKSGHQSGRPRQGGAGGGAVGRSHLLPSAPRQGVSKNGISATPRRGAAGIASYADMALARGVPASPARRPASAVNTEAPPPKQPQAAVSRSLFAATPAPRQSEGTGAEAHQHQASRGSQQGGDSAAVPSLLRNSVMSSDAGSWCSANSEQPLSSVSSE